MEREIVSMRVVTVVGVCAMWENNHCHSLLCGIATHCTLCRTKRSSSTASWCSSSECSDLSCACLEQHCLRQLVSWMESDVGGGSVWYHLHDQVVSGYSSLLSTPSQVVAGNPSRAERACQGNSIKAFVMESSRRKWKIYLPTAVISSHLISSIYAAHVLVVADDSCGACHFCPGTILLPSQHNTSFGWLAVRVHHHHDLPVHPSTSTNTLLLNC